MADGVAAPRAPFAELAPLVLFFLLAVLQPAGSVCYTLAGVNVPPDTRALWFLASWCALWAWWYAYAARKRLPLILDMGWFLAAAWPVVVPYFVLRNEGWKGLIPIVIYGGLWLGSMVAYAAVHAYVVVE